MIFFSIEIWLSVIIGYFIGSLPTAYIILKYRKGLDIRKEGSGNVGTLNSYEVTNSKLIGLTVLAIDLLKGILSVLIPKIIFGDEFIFPMISLIFSVFGHCYSIWLSFKGGRGLATAAGGFLLLSPIVLLSWGVSWLITYKIKKHIHFANISATIIVFIFGFFLSNYFNEFTFPKSNSNIILGISISLVMVIILLKHMQPIREFLGIKQ
jgi:glycerol-3-phosphate acyltransferase PlsY